MEAESRRVVAKGRKEREAGNYCLTGIEFQFWQKSSGDWSQNSENVLTLPTCMLKMVRVNIMLSVFYHN